MSKIATSVELERKNRASLDLLARWSTKRPNWVTDSMVSWDTTSSTTHQNLNVPTKQHTFSTWTSYCLFYDLEILLLSRGNIQACEGLYCCFAPLVSADLRCMYWYAWYAFAPLVYFNTADWTCLYNPTLQCRSCQTLRPFPNWVGFVSKPTFVSIRWI